jgi:type IV pilus assembly protein PilO
VPSRKLTIMTIIVLFTMIAGGGSYFYFLHLTPVQEKINKLQNSLKKEENALAVLEQKKPKTENILVQTTNLQMKLPVKPLVDQFLLQLEEIEVESGSLITSISFGEATDTKNAGGQQDTTVPQSVQDIAASETQNTEAGTDPTTEALPPGVEKLTANMVVEARTYFELEAFIKAIEELPRITKVDKLEFTGNGEVSIVQESSDKLTYNVTVSTYYYPELAELKKQLPKYDLPQPAEKINPLYQDKIPSASKSDNTQEPQTKTQTKPDSSKQNQEEFKTVIKNNKEYKVYTHVVKLGDTLFEIAIKYYNSRSGEQLIREWNNMDELQAGMTIEIPVPTQGNF